MSVSIFWALVGVLCLAGHRYKVASYRKRLAAAKAKAAAEANKEVQGGKT